MTANPLSTDFYASHIDLRQAYVVAEVPRSRTVNGMLVGPQSVDYTVLGVSRSLNKFFTVSQLPAGGHGTVTINSDSPGELPRFGIEYPDDRCGPPDIGHPVIVSERLQLFRTIQGEECIVPRSWAAGA